MTMTTNKNWNTQLMADRIKALRTKRGITGTEFGELFDRTKIWTHSVESGRTELNIQMLRTMKEKFGVTYDYLIDGAGEESDAAEIDRQRHELNVLHAERDDLKRQVTFLSEYIELLKERASA